MPFTPFFGISLIVHIGVIVGYYALRNLVDDEKTRRIPSENLNVVISVIVIFLVFSVVAINASILIRASLYDNHSSIKFVNSQIEKAFSSHSADENLDDGVTTGNLSGVCSSSSTALISGDEHSLVDYLKSKGLDSSFTARRGLASSLGMDGYQGTQAENVAILSTLLTELEEEAPAVIPDCK